MSSIIPVNGIRCPKCQNQNVEVIEYSDTVDFRGLELDVENLQESNCRSCGYKWVTKEQHMHNSAVLRETYGVMRDRIRKDEGLLSGTDIAQIRNQFGLSQREAATLFGGGYNAFNKYESGEVLQSFAMDRLLRLSAVVGVPAIEFLHDVFAPPRFFVVSTSIPNEVRITVGGGVGAFSRTPIRGTSETLQIEPPRILEYLASQKTLPIAREKYSVITR